jgi:hypothetical protein
MGGIEDAVTDGRKRTLDPYILSIFGLSPRHDRILGRLSRYLRTVCGVCTRITDKDLGKSQGAVRGNLLPSRRSAVFPNGVIGPTVFTVSHPLFFGGVCGMNWEETEDKCNRREKEK